MAYIIDSQQKNLIGDKVRQIRKEKNLSQQQLSDKLESIIYHLKRLIEKPFLSHLLLVPHRP